MTKKLSNKEKALLVLEKSRDAFDKCSKQLRETEKAFQECQKAFEYANDQMKRILNEEENDGNIHKECQWYNSEKDYCENYMMGCYTGLAFEVSRHKKCIDDMRKDGDVE